MEASRQQLESFRVNNQDNRPVLEEFIPVKHLASDQSSDQKATNMSDNKANWMTSAQLWSQASEAITKQQSTIKESDGDMIGFNNTSPNKLVLDNKQRNGGAFLPFSKERNSLQALPELALASAEKEIEDKKHADGEKGGSSCQKRESNISGNNDGVVIDQAKENSVASHAQNTNNNNNTQNQNHRKARRCWSPDLHRRFVNALQMLGGSQGNLDFS